MHDTGPIYLIERHLRIDDLDMMSLPVECDDVEHFTHALRGLISSGRTFVETKRSLSVGQSVTLAFSFPGLLRPLHLATTVASISDDSAPERGIDAELAEFGSDVQEQLSALIEKIETGNPKYVARTVRVLVVEDNPHCAKLIQEGLYLAGKRAFGNRVVFEVPMASNAADALSFLHSRPIDVLITDIFLGGVSGTSVIEHVRGESNLRSIPVIAISAGDDTTRQVAMEAGADIFLPKPVRLRQIVSTVGRVLNLEQVAWR
ncbi:MAG: response regulator [Proteobacteria bacterium]|nr:response regulator [Pseudomonadota bacterium]